MKTFTLKKPSVKKGERWNPDSLDIDNKFRKGFMTQEGLLQGSEKHKKNIVK